jgi:hypothetical protein
MKNYKLGMTLLEVIASMFIICIGLLSVLMVIPYGAFQVANARNAEYISNMLDAGAEDLQITGWDKYITNQVDISNPPGVNNPPDKKINIYIIDPFTTNPSIFSQIFSNATSELNIHKEIMTSSDDLKYKLHENARTEITHADPDDLQSPTSSGQYTYFITIKPQEILYNGDDTHKEFTGVKFTTDLLGCYQREDCFELVSAPDSWKSYLRAAEFKVTGNDRLDFSTTKYVLVTYTEKETDNQSTPITLTLQRGEWCKVVNVSNNKAGDQVITIVSSDVVSVKNNTAGALSNADQNDIRKIIVFPGVMYHKRIYD